MWDLSILQVVPGLRIAAPRDAATAAPSCCARRSRSTDGPTVVRFPKGRPAPTCPRSTQLGRRGRAARAASRKTSCWSASARWPGACLAGRRSSWPRAGLGVTVVDPRWVAAGRPGAGRRWRGGTGWCVTLEDSGRVGGVGAAVAQALRDAGVTGAGAHLRAAAARSWTHGKRAEVLADCGLTAAGIAGSPSRHRARLSQDDHVQRS